MAAEEGVIDAVVPAHNEQSTVRAVAETLLVTRLFGRVIVVDDGSTDQTAAEATAAGADVLQFATNRGKAAAMAAGVAASNARSIAFFDADALRLEPEHAQLLVDHFALGFTQVLGVQDHGILNPIYALAGPLVTGQRIVRRWVLDELPASCGGYSVETAINFIVDAHGGSTCVISLRGASFRRKASKAGVLRGWLQDLGMVRQMVRAQRALEETAGESCQAAER